jgi:diguanylate cyclase (GGDEF)-like protein
MSHDPDTPAPMPAEPAGGPAVGPDGALWVLVRYVGQPLGEVVPLPPDGLEIGRGAECGVCLAEPEVSRRHARLQPAGAATVELRDLGSTNGVFVNGRRAEADPGPVALLPGDVLRVGSHAFKLQRFDALERRYHEGPDSRTTLDALTGVCSRATVLHQLEAHFELARRHQRSLSVILADLDGLGRLNAANGPGAGDRVIQVFGGHLLRRLRGSDPVGRLGGQLFLAVLPETTSDLALTAADDLRLALADHWVELEEGRLVQASCSFGVADLKPGDADSGALLARADAALHRAKAEGRNRVAQAP